MNPVSYIRETSRELKKVTWPDRATTQRMTLVVIAISVLTGIYLGALDFVFNTLIGLVL